MVELLSNGMLSQPRGGVRPGSQVLHNLFWLLS
jgi:hypothetical protein